MNEIDVLEVGWFETKYGKSINDFKHEIAERSIDWSGDLSGFTLLVRVLRNINVFLIDDYNGGSDGYFPFDRFWFEFPIYSIGELHTFHVYNLSGEKDEIKDNVFQLLIECDFKRFNEKFAEFLTELYNWSYLEEK